MSRLLILSPLRQDSGNLCTVGRLRQHLLSKYECIVRDATALRTGELQQMIEDNDVCLVLGLHAFHAGRLLIDVTVPYILIFGGTDINEFYKDEGKLQTMTCAIRKAQYIICFSRYMIKQAAYLWPEIHSSKFITIPPAICTSPSSLSLDLLLKDRNYLVNSDTVIFTLVAGIRPVKDPTFILRTFSEWHMSKNQNVILVIVGPVIDKEYAMNFQSILTRCHGIYYLSSFPKEDTHAIIQQSFAIVNTSHSEGIANSILEAMDLGIPVIARNNAGNASLITHSQTGLLFEKPQECITQMEKLIFDSVLKESIVKNAKKAIQRYHSCSVEQSAYLDIIHKLTSKQEPNQKVETEQELSR